ncbi:ferric reductase NAD binding domain-containing protein [Crucibulum laeve]|uniref:ferric-chelate reductase (NADPH) n=1 Tax=Crucibulum laeve TaxID=68775 RepID=A0A5C3LZG0_9AGAR|nr:ferric reductase NAD binding domain-containing protein [Crucibulum laeve]
MVANIVNIATHVARQAAQPSAAVMAADPDKTIRVARFFSYPKGLLYFMAGFLALLTIYHFISLRYTYATRNRVVAPTKTRGKISLYRIPATIADTFRALAFRWVIPIGNSYSLNLTEVFLTMGYICIVFTWTLINTTTIAGVKVEPHYYANRAGTIAASQIPILAALGMRNNIFSLLTGVSFDKINFLHRAVARTLCVLIWLHGAGRFAVGLDGDEALVNRWVQCGLVAASALTLLCILSLRPMRELSYEIFHIVHFLFVFIFLLSMYFHLTGRNLIYYGAWPTFIVWGVERLLRVVRIVVFNFGYFKPKSKKSRELDATVSVLSPHFVRVTMRRPSHFHWRPGQSVYLAFPSISTLPLESHPFTISTIDTRNKTDKELVFLVRVRTGFTQRLSLVAEDEPVKVYLDGPYSSPPLLIGYHTIIMIAGGSGVAFTLPLLLDILERSKREKAVCQKVVFAWAIRDADHIQWITDSLSPALDNIPDTMTVDIQLFVTAAVQGAQAWEDDSVENDVEEKNSSNGSDPKILESPLVRVRQGRPNLKTLISDEISNASGAISVSVLQVCGNRVLANAVRGALRVPRPLDVLRGGPTVSLHVEAFGSAIFRFC